MSAKKEKPKANLKEEPITEKKEVIDEYIETIGEAIPKILDIIYQGLSKSGQEKKMESIHIENGTNITINL